MEPFVTLLVDSIALIEARDLRVKRIWLSPSDLFYLFKVGILESMDTSCSRGEAWGAEVRSSKKIPSGRLALIDSRGGIRFASTFW